MLFLSFFEWNANQGEHSSKNNESSDKDTVIPGRNTKTEPENEPATRVIVKADQDWQSTGFHVLRGEKILLEVVEGFWNAADGFLLDNNGRGYGYSCAQSAIANKDDTTRCVLGEYTLGALIASIGRTRYGIGNKCTFTATDSGEVYLRMNDNNSTGNSGKLVIEISRLHTTSALDNICGQPFETK